MAFESILKLFVLICLANQTETDLEKAFDEFDANSDGKLSVEELRHGMKERFGIRMTEREPAIFLAGFNSIDVLKILNAKI